MAHLHSIGTNSVLVLKFYKKCATRPPKVLNEREYIRLRDSGPGCKYWAQQI